MAQKLVEVLVRICGYAKREPWYGSLFACCIVYSNRCDYVQVTEQGGSDKDTTTGLGTATRKHAEEPTSRRRVRGISLLTGIFIHVGLIAIGVPQGVCNSFFYRVSLFIELVSI